MDGTTCQRHVRIGRRVRRALAISRQSARRSASCVATARGRRTRPPSTRNSVIFANIAHLLIPLSAVGQRWQRSLMRDRPPSRSRYSASSFGRSRRQRPNGPAKDAQAATAKLLLPSCYYPSCCRPCAFRRVPSIAWRKYRVIERCAGCGANTARLAAFMLYPLAHQCGNDVACTLPHSFPSFENPASSGPPRCGLFACRAAHVASFVLSFQHAAVGRCATCAVEVIGAASEAAMCAM